MHWPFELRDIFIGAWLATTIPHTEVPRFCAFVAAALRRPEFAGDVHVLIAAIAPDRRLRGLGTSRIVTCSYKLVAIAKLLFKCSCDPTNAEWLDARLWPAKSTRSLPSLDWSPEQSATMSAIADGLRRANANIARCERLVLTTGGPGTRKMEAVAHAVGQAAADWLNVLVAVPVGAMLDTYSAKQPASPNISLETIHASVIAHDADAEYTPLGRLRNFDAMFVDEARAGGTMSPSS